MCTNFQSKFRISLRTHVWCFLQRSVVGCGRNFTRIDSFRHPEWYKACVSALRLFRLEKTGQPIHPPPGQIRMVHSLPSGRCNYLRWTWICYGYSLWSNVGRTYARRTNAGRLAVLRVFICTNSSSTHLESYSSARMLHLVPILKRFYSRECFTWDLLAAVLIYKSAPLWTYLHFIIYSLVLYNNRCCGCSSMQTLRLDGNAFIWMSG